MFERNPHNLNIPGLEYSIHDDPDYALLLEFNSNIAERILANRKKPSSFNNKDLLSLIERFRTDINSLIVSEYFLNQATINIWTESGDYLTEDEDSDEDKETARKVSTLKEKIKREFVHRNELLLLSIVDTMVRLDLNEFVQLGGLELLLLLYEKHKDDENYVNVIGNCLCLISLEPKYRSLFVQSGVGLLNIEFKWGF